MSTSLKIKSLGITATFVAAALAGLVALPMASAAVTTDSPCATGVTTIDQDLNGHIDGLLVTFGAGNVDCFGTTADETTPGPNAAVLPEVASIEASFAAGAWTVSGGYTLLDVLTDAEACSNVGNVELVYATGTCAVPGTPVATAKTGTTVPNALFVLGENIAPDTDAVPSLKYTSPTDATKRIVEAGGDEMATWDAAEANRKATDAAAPVMTKIVAVAGQSTVTMHFSEPVNDGTTATSASLVRTDFTYTNSAAGGATAFHGTTELTHTAAGAETAVATLDAPVVAADAAAGTGDRIKPSGATVQEAGAGTLTVATTDVLLRLESDTTAPTISEYFVYDDNADGFLDLVRIKFSEAINRNHISPAAWSLEAPYADNKLAIQKPVTSGLGLDCGTTDAKYVCFTIAKNTDGSYDHPNGDTDQLPKLTYTQSKGAMRDVAGNALAPVGAVPPGSDVAPPAIVRVSATLGTPYAVIVFSEPVEGSGGSGEIILPDLTYGNTGGTAQSLVDVTHPYTSDDQLARIEVTPDLTLTDMSGGSEDTIAVETLGDIEEKGAGLLRVPVTPVKLLDHEAPTISKRETLDVDGNGRIDAIKLTFSEPIDDSVSTAEASDFVVTGYTVVNVLRDAADVRTNTFEAPAVAITGDNYDATVGAAASDDAVWVITVNEKVGSHDGAAVPTVKYTHNADAAKRIKDLAAAANIVTSDSSAVASVDKVVPVQVSALTGDLDNDGMIDRVVVTYTEDVVAGTDLTPNFAVAGYAAGSVAAISGKTLTITFDEKVGADTAATPAISSDPNAIADVAGNPAAQLAGMASDGARPVLMSAVLDDGPAMLKLIHLTFSEPVENGIGGALAKSFFTYTNGGTGCSTQAIASIAEVDDTVAPASPVSSTWDLTMDSDLARTCDLGADKVAVVTDKVFDVADNAALSSVEATVGGGALLISSVVSLDQDGDGMLDALAVHFSESIADPDPFFLPLEDWNIFKDTGACASAGKLASPADIPAGFFAPTSVTGGLATFQPTSVSTGTTSNDNILVLHFAEGTAGTGAVGNLPCLAFGDGGVNTPIKSADNDALSAVGWTADIVDGAAPAIVSANTQDGAAAGTTKNGRLDSIKVTFSENVVPASVVAGDWKADGAAVTKTTVSGTGGGLVSDIVQFEFAEGSVANTGATPALTYTKGSLRDEAGATDNFLPDLAAGKVVVQDKAHPVVVSAVGEVGQNLVEVTFSEPTFGDGNVGALRIGTDLVFKNHASGTQQAAVSVAHNGGSATATITLDLPIQSTNDFGADAVWLCGGTATTPCAATGKARDILNNAVVDHKILLTSGAVGDTTPPAAVKNLVLVADSETSTTVQLQWTAPGDDGNTGTVSSYEIRYSTSAITSQALYDAATVATATFSPTAFVTAGGTQKATVTGLDHSTAYFFAVIAKDDNGRAGPFAAAGPFSTETVDSIAPADITDLTAVKETANSVRLSWTAPGDDDATGTVASYIVKVGTSAITDADFDAATSATVDFVPETLVAGGTTQEALVTGLLQDTVYHFAIKAKDEADNTNALATVSGSTDKDTTPPTGTITLSSSTHTSGVGTSVNVATFEFGGLTDSESDITYFFAFDQNESYEIKGTETTSKVAVDQSTLLEHTQSNVPEGTWYFHVAGMSAGGLSETKTMNITVVSVYAGLDLADKNKEMQKSVKVTKDGTTYTVEFDPTSAGKPDIVGVQIWRATSPFTLAATLKSTDAEFTAGKFVDNDVPAGKTPTYLVTVYYAEDKALGFGADITDVPGFENLSEAELKALGSVGPAADSTDDGGTNWLVIGLIIGGVLLLILIIVLIVVLARRGKGGKEGDAEDAAEWSDEPAEAADADDDWDDDTPEPSKDDDWSDDDDSGDDDDDWEEPAPAAAPAPAPEPAGDLHYLTCPSCSHDFTAKGVKPFTTTCPSCNAQGVLR